MFIELAKSHAKSDSSKAALLYILAGECKARQGKDNDDETLEAGQLFLKTATKDKSYSAKGAFQCASKCFLKVGKIDEAKKAFNQSKEIVVPEVSVGRPIVIVDDSKAISMKIEKYLEQLGYVERHTYHTGKEGIDGCKKLLSNSQNPIVLLDMGLPDVTGDAVASKLLDEKLDLQIIIITADEKTTKRVNKTISSGVAAFIQKPFTLDELKKALDVAESEYALS